MSTALVTSGVGVTVLVIEIIMLVITVIAQYLIIRKAGFPLWYLLFGYFVVPVYFITSMTLKHSKLDAGLSLTKFSIPLLIDFGALLISWSFFLVIAFKPWPIERDLTEALTAKATRVVSSSRVATADDETVAGAAKATAGGLACSNCATVNPVGAKFCYNCGRFVAGAN
jgi:hypothetical protein